MPTHDRDESNFPWDKIYLEVLPCLHVKLKEKRIRQIWLHFAFPLTEIILIITNTKSRDKFLNFRSHALGWYRQSKGKHWQISTRWIITDITDNVGGSSIQQQTFGIFLNQDDYLTLHFASCNWPSFREQQQSLAILIGKTSWVHGTCIKCRE